jgi:hypothetical protein
MVPKVQKDGKEQGNEVHKKFFQLFGEVEVESKCKARSWQQSQGQRSQIMHPGEITVPGHQIR